MRYFREPVSYATMPNCAAKSAETFLAPLQRNSHGSSVTEGFVKKMPMPKSMCKNF